MKSGRKRILYTFIILLVTGIIAGLIYLNSLLPIITGYAAKNLCSAVFISERNQEDVEELDLNFSFIRYNNNTVDADDKSVTSKFLWGKSKAIYREGFGTTLLRDINENELKETTFPEGTSADYDQDVLMWPLGNILPDSMPEASRELKNISDSIIKNDAYGGHISAFLVMQSGVPVVELYKPGYNVDTKFLSWSMAKSFTNSLTGIMVGKGMLDIDQPLVLDEWKYDERKNITVKHLMQMQSGLKWNEDYGNKSDVTVMLHCEADMGKYALEQEAQYPAGTHWYYSSGTTNIVCEIMHRRFGNDSLYYSFARKELFNRIGMPGAVLEVDPSGSWVGSSYLYATARDYARFALLYLNDGVFNNERILPEGWVEYSTTEVPDSKGQYGAFFWLNRSKRIKTAPVDMFSCNGHDGQYIFMIPSKDLAIIILGYSPEGIDLERLLGDVLDTL